MVEIENSFKIIAGEIIEFDIKPHLDISFSNDFLLAYDIEQEQQLNKEKRLLFFNTSVGIRKKETGELLVSLKALTVFEIRDFEKNVQLIEPNQFSLPREINTSMSRIAVSVTRGLLSGKLKDTYLPHAILPLLPFEY
ncbi:MAG: hypothetical protein J0I09_08120 [Sphingobacteriia bacterium]|nr:hypothetical protein [Sphingobacteriia bacterium]